MVITAKKVWAVTLTTAKGEKHIASHSPIEWAIFSKFENARAFAKELRKHLGKTTVRVTRVNATLTIEETK